MREQHQCVEYFNALFEPEDLLCISLLHKTKTFANGLPLMVNKFVQMSKVIAPAGIKRLTKLNHENNIFCSMAVFTPGTSKRVKDNIANVDRVFIEADENGEAVLAAVRASVAAKEIPPPTIVVESSPAKFQFIWATENFDVATQVAMNRTLQQKFGTDPASTDATRVLRVPGFRNLKKKYGPVKPVARIVEHNKYFLRHEPSDFAIGMTVKPDTAVHAKAEDAEVQQAIDLLLTALDAAHVPHGKVEPWSDAFKILPQECPWADAHTNGMRGDAVVGVQPSAKYFFKCLHGHCADKTWKEFRAYLEQRAGRKLKFKPKSAPRGKD